MTTKSNRVEEKEEVSSAETRIDKMICITDRIIENIDRALDLLYIIDFKNYKEEKESYYYKLLKELKS